MIKEDTKENLVGGARFAAAAPLGLLYAGSTLPALLFSTGIAKQGYDSLAMAGGAVQLTAVAAACGLGIAVARNIKLSDFAEAGPALRNIGQGIMDKARQAGQALGILKEGQSATNKVAIEGAEPKEPWSKLAFESVALAVAPIAIAANTMAISATAMTMSGNSSILPVALGAAATAVAADYLLYKAVKENVTFVKGDDLEAPTTKRDRDRDVSYDSPAPR